MAAQNKVRAGAAAGFTLLAALLFIFNAALRTHAAPPLLGTQGLYRNGSIRPDGKLDFLGPDGTVLATIDIEVAETAEAHRKGLMGRTALRLTEGMLFIFERAELRFFWMYATPLSLDMIFADPQRRIVHITESTLPMSTQTYGSQFPARYVVEVPAGFARFFKIKKGMRIQWQRR